jgi:hypothetical protein
MRAPDGWDLPRFLEIILNFGNFPFQNLFSPAASNASRWALVIFNSMEGNNNEVGYYRCNFR